MTWIATVLLETPDRFEKQEVRTNDLIQITSETISKTQGNGVILFPAGWFNTTLEPKTIYVELESQLRPELKQYENRKVIVVFGVDGRNMNDQVALAVDKTGILAIARKFFPTTDEKGRIFQAKDIQEKEDGKPRTFQLEGETFFMCVCYDVFGVKESVKPGEVSVILDLVHVFGLRKDDEPSGDANFARKGLAGAAKAWRVPVFASTVFLNREITEFPTGVKWDQGDMSVKNWRYDKNPIKPRKNPIEIKLDSNLKVKKRAVIRLFDV